MKIGLVGVQAGGNQNENGQGHGLGVGSKTGYTKNGFSYQ